MMRGIYFLPLLLLLLIAPAHGYYWDNQTDCPYTATFYTSQYADSFISQVDLVGFETPSNTVIIMSVPGTSEVFTIWYNTTVEGLGVRTQGAVQNLTGAIETFDETAIAPLAYLGYSRTGVLIQYSYNDWAVDVTLTFSVYPNAIPAHHTWSRGSILLYQDWAQHRDSIIPYSQVQIDSTSRFDAYAVYATLDEIEQLATGSLIGLAVSDVGGALWSGFLFLVRQIPVIGPAFAQVFEILKDLVYELVWLLDFIIVKNWLGTLILIEFLAISEALIWGQKRSNIQLMKRVARNHVLMYTAVVGIVMFLWDNIILRLISAVGDLMPG